MCSPLSGSELLGGVALEGEGLGRITPGGGRAVAGRTRVCRCNCLVCWKGVPTVAAGRSGYTTWGEAAVD